MMKAFKKLDTNKRMSVYKREDAEGWREVVKQPQFFKPDPSWTIAIIPPFCGAAGRFLVQNKHGAQTSVYLDTCEALGYYGGEVYWEIHPVDDDVFRCDYEDTEALMGAIRKSLRQGTKFAKARAELQANQEQSE